MGCNVYPIRVYSSFPYGRVLEREEMLHHSYRPDVAVDNELWVNDFPHLVLCRP